uniref:Putative membrane protein n=1 Tax=Megaviridae environmental sample TaxID=1737588 RepID=A0A5J6VN10_9VIRU|nr:MAG: putative membrane protein [Megaviridae environmental sample]
MSKETLCRTIVKTIGWRVIGAMTTFSIAYFVDHNMDNAIKISILDSTINLAFYFFYERGFSKLKWGYVLEDEHIKDINVDTNTEDDINNE